MVVLSGMACSHPGLPGTMDPPADVVPPGHDEEKPNITEIDTTQFEDGTTIYGRVCSEDGSPIGDVAVSDGVTVALTDVKGYYSLKSDKKKGFVFISVPGNYIPEKRDNLPLFSKMLCLSKNQMERHDFKLFPADNSRFTLLVHADQHLAKRTDDLNQLKEFVLPDMNATISAERSAGRKVYSISLGDISWEQYWNANSFGLTDAVRNFALDDCVIYHTIGNHDNNPYIADDWKSSSIFRNNICPTYYSFNIGKIHFVVLDNVIYNNNNATSSQMGDRSYDRALTEEQLEWLAEDLKVLESPETPVIISAHVPFYSDPTLSSETEVVKRNMLNMESLEAVLAPFRNVILFSGHYHRNYCVQSPYCRNIREYNVASLSGSLWWTARSGYSGKHLCTDGSPGGYGILRVNDTVVDYTYKGIGCSEGEQFRVYDLNKVVINESSVSGNEKYKAMVKDYAGQYYNPAKANFILVNVYAWQPDWKIEILENGVQLNVTRLRVKDPLHILAYECQRLSHNAVPTATSTFVTQNSSHFFRAKASMADSDVTVRVTDNKGKVWKQTLQRPYPFSLAAY